MDLPYYTIRTYVLPRQINKTLARKNVRSFFIRQDMSQDEKKKLSRNLSDKFREFITQHPPSQFNRRLRCLLLDYMMIQQKVGFPLDFHIHLWELSDLFMLLDCAEDEWEKKSNPEITKSAT